MKNNKTDLKTEFPTWVIIFSVYFLWWAVLSNFSTIPFAHLFLILILTFHGSVQHEILHGHPTRYQGLNFPAIRKRSCQALSSSSFIEYIPIPINSFSITQLKGWMFWLINGLK